MTASIRRTVASADDKLTALRNIARAMADDVQRGLITKQDAVDAAYDAALAHGLPRMFGDDAVQAVLAESFVRQ